MNMNDFVDQKKLNEFITKVGKMATEEFGYDDCGGNKIEIEVIDRSRYWRSRWFPVPYEHKASSTEELEKCFDRYITNLSIATEEMDKFLKSRRYEVDRIKREEAKARDSK